ncbi:MAG TPA: hypothetical protein PLI09_02785 [Candidatus Hydrogenedentes bacterium]|nr:hypothetical protein [Candidatus Hydrogenedentota bacterium]
MYLRKKSPANIPVLIDLLAAKMEIIITEDMSAERIMYNSPSIKDVERIEVVDDTRARKRAQRSLKKFGRKIVPHLLDAILTGQDNDSDFYERAVTLLVEQVESGPSNIYPRVVEAVDKAKDKLRIRVLLDVMYRSNSFGALCYCAEKIAKLQCLNQRENSHGNREASDPM